MCSRPGCLSRLLNHVMHPALLLNWPQSIWKRSSQKHIKEQLRYLNSSNPGHTPMCPCKKTTSSWKALEIHLGPKLTWYTRKQMLCVCLANGNIEMLHWKCISHRSACLVKASRVLSGFSLSSLQQQGGGPLPLCSDWREVGSVRDDRERWCCCGDTAGEDREPLWDDGRLGKGARTSRLSENYRSASA